MKMKRLTRPLNVKAVNEDGSFEGYGSVFNVMDSYRDIVLPGAFKASLKYHKQEKSSPALLWQHDPDNPIGVWKSMEEDEHGLKMTGQLALGTQKGKEAYELLKMGAVKGLSIGFSIGEDGEKFNEDEKVWELSQINLWETSIVTFPANRAAQITDVRADLENPREFERQLRDVMGLSQSQAKRLMSGGYSALSRDDDYSPALEAAKELLKSLKGQ